MPYEYEILNIHARRSRSLLLGFARGACALKLPQLVAAPAPQVESTRRKPDVLTVSDTRVPHECNVYINTHTHVYTHIYISIHILRHAAPPHATYSIFCPARAPSSVNIFHIKYSLAARRSTPKRSPHSARAPRPGPRRFCLYFSPSYLRRSMSRHSDRAATSPASARLAHSAKHKALNIVVVSSSPAVAVCLCFFQVLSEMKFTERPAARIVQNFEIPSDSHRVTHVDLKRKPP